ncbi:MAG: hypothetical protein JWL71_4723 [Acidobacteria bacterium]|nr:hypothetical protein [Acidobacteriota bacterium]
MWQPRRAQWSIIWIVTVLVILAWPPDDGRSLFVKALNRAADPFSTLAAWPAPLPIGLGDDGDAVSAHDGQEAEYYRQYNSSPVTRWRMDLKAARDPIDPSTARQLLVGIAVLSALAAWRLGRTR